MLSDSFYTINFIILIITSIICLIFALLFIIIVIIDVQHHTITNLLSCNTTVAIICYTITELLSYIFGLRGDWLYHQPLCIVRAYCTYAFSSVICYSYLIQAISRLCLIVFNKYKHLQTYRVHWILITVSWLIGMSIPLVMFIINNEIFILQKEIRFCITTSTELISSIYGVITAYTVPLSIITIIYSVILQHARQSTRRVVNFDLNSITKMTIAKNSTLTVKRELKLMKNMMILLDSFTCSGTPYFILVLWPVVFKVSPPEPLYLLSLSIITITIDYMMVITFFMSKDVRKYFFETLRKLSHDLIN